MKPADMSTKHNLDVRLGRRLPSAAGVPSVTAAARWVLLLLLALRPFPALAGDTAGSTPEIDRALVRMYNFDFTKAQKILDEHIAGNPDDPLGYSMLAAVHLFSELDRLMILEGEFFTDDRRIREKNTLKADPAVRERLYKAVGEAQSRARSILAKRPDDRNALFSQCMATGVLTDYAGFVEKRKLASLSYAKQSHNYALELLRHHPSFSDAYLTTGLTEYLLGSMPFFVRWFVRFDQAEGSKAQAVKNLELVAREGRYLGPFARILLAIIHFREKRPREAQKLLEVLARDYPENHLIRKELAKLSKAAAEVSQ